MCKRARGGPKKWVFFSQQIWKELGNKINLVCQGLMFWLYLPSSSRVDGLHQCHQSLQPGGEVTLWWSLSVDWWGPLSNNRLGEQSAMAVVLWNETSLPNAEYSFLQSHRTSPLSMHLTWNLQIPTFVPKTSSSTKQKSGCRATQNFWGFISQTPNWRLAKYM